MTPEQLALVEASAAEACADRRAFAERFYGHLFEIAPEVRPMFPDDMAELYEKLVEEVAFLTRAAADLDVFLGRARDLGRRHRSYGVSPDHYRLVEDALVVALRRSVGPAWSSDHEAAWQALYRLIAEVMLEGASEAIF